MTKIRQNPVIKRFAFPAALVGWALYIAATLEGSIFTTLAAIPALAGTIFQFVGDSLSVAPGALKLGFTKLPPDVITGLHVIEDGATVVVDTPRRRFRISRWMYHPDDWPLVLECLGGKPGALPPIYEHAPERW